MDATVPEGIVELLFSAWPKPTPKKLTLGAHVSLAAAGRG